MNNASVPGRESSALVRSKLGRMDRSLKRQAGVTLTELMCVMAIILILMALYLPAIARAFKRVQHFLGGM